MPEGFISGEIFGGKETSIALKKLDSVMRKKVIARAARAASRELVKEVKTRVPRSTVDRDTKFASKKRGFKKHLADSIRVSTISKGADSVELSVHISSAFWGRFLEFGTSKMKKRPWFRPSFDAAAPKMLSALRKSLAQSIKREAKKAAKIKKV